MKKPTGDLMPLILIVGLLSALSHFWAGHKAIPWINVNRIQIMIWFAAAFAFFHTVITIIESAVRAREFVADDSGQVDIRALWQTLSQNP